MRCLQMVAAVAAMALTGCAALEGVSFGLALANAETTISVRHGDGKTVLEAQQDGKTVRAHYSGRK